MKFLSVPQVLPVLSAALSVSLRDAPVWLCPASWFYPLSGGLLLTAILIIPHDSANVEFFDFYIPFLIYGYTGMGTKMFYDSISSSVDYSSERQLTLSQ